MSDVTVVGLGLMGTALVRTLRRSGYSVSIWNRSPDKCSDLAGDGVTPAPTIADAVSASPATIMCVDHPNATRALLDSEEVIPRLEGRVVIQLSTCLPKVAREAETWLLDKSAEYLDGAILCGPKDLGTSDGQILLSGRSDTYEKVKAILDCLGGNIGYLGENVASASALDLAWLSTRFGRFLGIVHAANVCRSEGVDMKEFTSLFPDDDQVQYHGGTIRDGSYESRSATLDVWHASLKLLQAQAEDAGINADFPRVLGDFFAKAVDAGYGDEHVMAIYKAMRDAGRTPSRSGPAG